MTDHDYFSGDIKRLWQDQIAGVVDIDSGSFLGAMADLQSDPDWQEAFKAIRSDTGMQGFLERTQKHFDLCSSPQDADGSVFAYQHPTRTNQDGTAKDSGAMLALMKRHLATVAKAANAYDKEEAGRVKQLKVVWTDDWDSVDDDPYSRDGAPADISIYGAMGDIEDEGTREGVPRILRHIREACYGLAASYDLQRYLMQDFYTHGYDVDALYELEWVHGCGFYFDDESCYVFDEAARKAAKQ